MPGKAAFRNVAEAIPQTIPEAAPPRNHPALFPVERESRSQALSAAIERTSSLQYTFLKRAIDIVLSSLLLIALFPLGLVIALLIVLTSSGPVFYRQQRVGRFGAPFRIIKFRSMYTSARRGQVFAINETHRHSYTQHSFVKTAHDPRVTPCGRLIRKLSLDELPQLFNVLAGHMSLVGPRPIVEAERQFYGSCLPYYDLVAPGITGLWQVSGRSTIGYEGRVLLDRDYVSGWSCLLDLLILARTIPAVLSTRGAY